MDDENVGVETPVSVADPSEFMNEAAAIAERLNHKEVQVAHLLLAMTKTSKGVEHLASYGLVAEVVHRSCWRELGSTDWRPRDPYKVENSADIKDVYERAARIGQDRGNAKQAEVQIGDILQAITLPPLNGRFVSICKGEVKIPTTEETRESVALVAMQLKSFFPKISIAINGLNTALNTLHVALNAISGKVENIIIDQSAMTSKIDAVGKDIGKSVQDEGSLRQTVDAFEKRHDVFQGKVLDQRKHTKHMDNVLLGLSITIIVLLVIFATVSGLYIMLR